MNQKQLEKYLWVQQRLYVEKLMLVTINSIFFPYYFLNICDVYDEEYVALDKSSGDREYAAFAENHHFKYQTMLIGIKLESKR